MFRQHCFRCWWLYCGAASASAHSPSLAGTEVEMPLWIYITGFVATAAVVSRGWSATSVGKIYNIGDGLSNGVMDLYQQLRGRQQFLISGKAVVCVAVATLSFG